MEKSLNLKGFKSLICQPRPRTVQSGNCHPKATFQGTLFPFQPQSRHRVAWPPACRRLHLPGAARSQPLAGEWGREKQWQNESPWRILGKKRTGDCPSWLHSLLLHLVLGCGYWGVACSQGSFCLPLVCISIFKMALCHGTVVNQMLKLERSPKLVLDVTIVRD